MSSDEEDYYLDDDYDDLTLKQIHKLLDERNLVKTTDKEKCIRWLRDHDRGLPIVPRSVKDSKLYRTMYMPKIFEPQPASKIVGMLFDVLRSKIMIQLSDIDSLMLAFTCKELYHMITTYRLALFKLKFVKKMLFEPCPLKEPDHLRYMEEVHNNSLSKTIEDLCDRLTPKAIAYYFYASIVHNSDPLYEFRDGERATYIIGKLCSKLIKYETIDSIEPYREIEMIQRRRESLHTIKKRNVNLAVLSKELLKRGYRHAIHVLTKNKDLTHSAFYHKTDGRKLKRHEVSREHSHHKKSGKAENKLDKILGFYTKKAIEKLNYDKLIPEMLKLNWFYVADYNPRYHKPKRMSNVKSTNDKPNGKSNNKLNKKREREDDSSNQ